MKGCLRKAFFVFCSVLLVVGLSLVVVVPVGAWESLVWEGDVYSSGVPVTSSPLNAGTSYRFVASEVWFYDDPHNLAADAQYYTTSGADSWDWLNSRGLVVTRFCRLMSMMWIGGPSVMGTRIILTVFIMQVLVLLLCSESLIGWTKMLVTMFVMFM